MSEFFTQKEFDEINYFIDAFFENLDDNFLDYIKTKYNTSKNLNPYHKLPIRKRVSLAEKLQENIFNGVYADEENIEIAKVIIYKILLTIMKDKNKIEIVSDIPDNTYEITIDIL